MPSADSSAVFLSVVIPAYNEAQRIPSTLRQILSYVGSLHKSYEVVVVDDGSTDGTAAVVNSFSVRLLQNSGNCGKGAAVRNGMLNARGKYILFTDADLSAPITDAAQLLTPLADGYDVVVGSRALRRDWIGVHQSAFRESAGKIFNFFIRLLTGLTVYDTQCGFKAFRRTAAQDIFARQRIPGFGFDVESLYLARKFGFKTLEVPVHWDHNAASKVHPVRDGARMVLEVLKIKWNDYTGKYGRR
ncbi:MAG: glycosyltransferase family 2 protein [Acidobacteria bacterium]|nr:glycosyltransferase family 2 protein [Acidobacteriota bacterium]